MTVILQLILGVPSTAYLGDPSPVEPEPQIIDLLDSNAVIQSESTSGFRQYDRAITALKNGGITVDSQSVDGTEYLAQPVGDVSESIPCIASGTDPVARAAAISKLLEFARSVRQFHSTTSYPFVPYIKVQELGDAGPRYALINTMSVSISGGSFEQQTQDIVINYTREPYWRGLAPGDNPIKWALENVHDLTPSTTAGAGKYTYADLELYLFDNNHLYTTDTDALGGVTNMLDRADNVLPVTRNFVKIPKENVPGDAPALINLAFQNNSSNDYILRVGKQTIDFDELIDGGAFFDRLSPDTGLAWTPFDNTISGVVRAGVTSTTTAAAAGTGVPYATNYRYQDIAYSAAAAGNDSVLMRWDDQRVPSRYGRYIVFFRTRFSSGTISQVNLKLRFTIRNTLAGSTSYTYETPSFTVRYPAGATNNPGASYLGQLSIPLDAMLALQQNLNGLGISDDANMDMRIELLGSNSVTATLTFRAYDLLLIPIEQYAEFRIFNNNTGGAQVFNYDNTGYLTRARGETAISWVPDAPNDPYIINTCEIRGGQITLEPGKDTYLYFMTEGLATGIGSGTDDNANIDPTEGEVWLNIIPRWQNLRDE